MKKRIKNYKPERNQEIATIVSNGKTHLISDAGGRRSGIDRRLSSSDAYQPDRRSGRERRSMPDRRSSPHFKLYTDVERRQAFKSL